MARHKKRGLAEMAIFSVPQLAETFIGHLFELFQQNSLEKNGTDSFTGDGRR